MSLSNYGETKLGDWIRGSASMPAATTPYLALFSDNPGDNDTGTEETTNVASGGRLAVTFAAPVDGVLANASDINFGNSENDVVISHFGIYDAQTSGNLIAHGALASPKTIDTSDEVKWAAGSLTLTIT